MIIGSLCLPGCEQKKDNQEEVNVQGSIGLSASYGPSTYYSLRDFESSVKASRHRSDEIDIYNLSELDYYYLPHHFAEAGTLKVIYVKDVYVCIEDSLADIDLNGYEDPHEREIARLANTIKFEWSRNLVEGEGPALLENAINVMGLRAFVSAESSVNLYYKDVYYPTAPEAPVLITFYWVADGYRFNLDLPIEIFEAYQNEINIVEIITAIDQVVV